jgi:predicted transcriptional regulator
MKKSVIREALPKPNVLQLSQYNITQKIMDSLVNTCHRAVLFSIVDKAKYANEIADELNISLSAVYKTLNQLENLTLVQVEKFTFLDGKKIKIMMLFCIYFLMKTTKKMKIDYYYYNRL